MMLFCLPILRIPIAYIVMAFSEVGAKLIFDAYRLQEWGSSIATTENHKEKEGKR